MTKLNVKLSDTCVHCGQGAEFRMGRNLMGATVHTASGEKRCEGTPVFHLADRERRCARCDVTTVWDMTGAWGNTETCPQCGAGSYYSLGD